ncbi:MAG: superoxide dismutase family protein [Terriglobia bacterium]
MMKKLLLLSGIFCLFVCPFSVQAAKKAKAALLNAKGAPVGTATFSEKPNGVQLDLKVSNLSPGLHGFHIHSVGRCEAPDFKSAGPHFNPEGKQHGWDNPQGHHLGDLQNLDVGSNGKATVRIVVPGVTLGEGPNSLFHEGGASLVIHEKPDDGKTDPAGNAGARIACGVIMR